MVEMRFRLAGITPVESTMPDWQIEGGWYSYDWMAVTPTCFNQSNGAVWVDAQSVGKHATGRACANDEDITMMIFSCHRD